MIKLCEGEEEVKKEEEVRMRRRMQGLGCKGGGLSE